MWMFWKKSTSQPDSSSPNANPINRDDPDNFTPTLRSQRGRWRSSSQSYLNSSSSQSNPPSPKHLSNFRPQSGSVYQYTMEDSLDVSPQLEPHSAIDETKYSMDTVESPMTQDRGFLELECKPSNKPWIYRR